MSLEAHEDLRRSREDEEETGFWLSSAFALQSQIAVVVIIEPSLLMQR